MTLRSIKPFESVFIPTSANDDRFVQQRFQIVDLIGDASFFPAPVEVEATKLSTFDNCESKRWNSYKVSMQNTSVTFWLVDPAKKATQMINPQTQIYTYSDKYANTDNSLNKSEDYIINNGLKVKVRGGIIRNHTICAGKIRPRDLESNTLDTLHKLNSFNTVCYQNECYNYTGVVAGEPNKKNIY